MTGLLQLVTFRVADMRIGVDIRSVVEVLPTVPITRVPSAPDFMAGVIHRQGHIIPILILRSRFGLPEAPPDAQSRILLASIERDVVGFLVDRVDPILVKADPGDVQSPPPALAPALADFFQGVLRIGEELVVLIDPHRVVSGGERSRMQRAARGEAPPPA